MEYQVLKLKISKSPIFNYFIKKKRFFLACIDVYDATVYLFVQN